MPPQATSTTVLIIVLILNMLSAAPPQQWPPMANTQEIAYQIVDLSSDADPFAGHRSWLPPMDIRRVHFGIANTTEPSVLLHQLVSLPSQQDHSARHCVRNNTTVNNNRKAPWTSLPLEPGIYGPPRARDKPVCSNPLGLNISLDAGPFSLSYYYKLMLMPPMVESEDQRISDPSFFLDDLLERPSYEESDLSFYSYKESVSAAQPRKLLLGATADGTNLHGHQMVHEKHAVAAAWVAFCLALLLCFAAGLLFWCTRSSLNNERSSQPADLCPSGPRRYSHHELAAATCGFSDERKIGRGGFGPVYWGSGLLGDQASDVAIKVLQGSSLQEQGRREFQAEVKVMTRLRHRNIVQLLGWCDVQGGLMLVYEFVPNGSLDKHLHDPQRLLAWADRYKIALGVGSAILYLHTECEHLVLHGDIKPANILLDGSCNAKLGDFGLARLIDHGNGTDSSPTTQVVAGTPGYMDPAFVSNQRPCAESDVFSFGVLLLEIACGRRPTMAQPTGTPLLLLNWVRDMYSKNSVLGVADRRLDGEFDGRQMRRVLVVGLWCTHHDQSERPSMAQAMDLLRREDAELPLLDLVSHGPDAVRSLEEIAYGDLSPEDSASEGSSTDTAYHTSTDSSCLLE